MYKKLLIIGLLSLFSLGAYSQGVIFEESTLEQALAKAKNEKKPYS